MTAACLVSTLELWRVVYGKEVNEEWAGGGGAVSAVPLLVTAGRVINMHGAVSLIIAN